MPEVSPAITSKWSKGTGGPAGDECQNLVAHTLRGEGFDASEDGTGRWTPLVPCVAPTLQAGGNGTGGHRPPGTTVDTCASLVPVAFDTTQITSPANRSSPKPGDPCHTMSATGDAPTIAFGGQMSVPQVDVEISQTLQAKNPQAVATGVKVRRITPVEAERLQGAPDNWTLVKNAAGKLLSDGPRYKMVGNSFAVPVITWIGQRIQLAMEG